MTEKFKGGVHKISCGEVMCKNEVAVHLLLAKSVYTLISGEVGKLSSFA